MAEGYASYSQLTVHRKCPQRYNYAHIRGLERVDPEDVRVELEFGLWWHALRAADSIERGLAHESLQWVPATLGTVDGGPVIEVGALADLRARHEHDGHVDLVRTVLETAEQWWRSLSEFVHETWVERLGGGLLDRLRYVDARWHERWDADIAHERPLAVEFKWRRVLPTVGDDGTGQAVDPDTAMSGYVDELYFDARRRMVVSRDHKSHKTLGTRTSADDMMESQNQIYAWGASPDVTAWGYGPIRAVAYDRVRSTAPKQPSITKTAGSLSKSVTDYDLATYLAFAAGPDGDGVPWGEPDAVYASGAKKGQPKPSGKYTAEDAVIARLTDPAAMSAWQQRTLTPLNRNIVTTHLRAAVDTALDIRHTRERAARTGAAARNLTDACKWCPFAELCRAEMTGGTDGDYDLAGMYLREKPKRRR